MSYAAIYVIHIKMEFNYKEAYMWLTQETSVSINTNTGNKC